MTTKPECPYCGEREHLRIACKGMPGWTDPDYICPACYRAGDTGPAFDDLPAEVDRDDVDMETLDAPREPANVNVDPMQAMMQFVMFGRRP